MLCQQCKKNRATVFLNEIYNGECTSLKLCVECCAALNEEIKLRRKGSFTDAANLQNKVKQCPKCKMIFSKYQESGLLGCPACYAVFREELLPYVLKIQGNVKHVGKVGTNSVLGLQKKLSELQSKLKEALARKDYVEASALNREMGSITRQIKEGVNE